MIAVLFPSPALAEVCSTARPLWDPATGPATYIDEALHLATSPIALALMLVTALSLRFRSQWGGLAAVSGWSFVIYLRMFSADPDGFRQMAADEGCLGSPTLFIAVVAAICVGTILYTAPIERGDTD